LTVAGFALVQLDGNAGGLTLEITNAFIHEVTYGVGFDIQHCAIAC